MKDDEAGAVMRLHVELLARNVLVRPDDTAYVWNGDPVSWRELERAAAQLAGGLIELGLCQGDHVVTLLPHGRADVELAFATARVGMTRMQVDGRLAKRAIGAAIRSARPNAVVVDALNAGSLRSVLRRSGASVFIAHGMGADLPPVWFDYDELRDFSPAWPGRVLPAMSRLAGLESVDPEASVASGSIIC